MKALVLVSGFKGEFKHPAIQGDDEVIRWTSNGRVPFDDMLESNGISEAVREKCAIAREIDTTAFLTEYTERMKNHVPSDEEMFEMRSAFGEGATVVNIITGKRTKL